MKKAIFAALTAGVVLAAGLALAGGKVHWSYSGGEGPANWGKLHPKFTACLKGKNQTPIDIKGGIEAKLAPIAFNYAAPGKEILNNGHTVQVNLADGAAITVEGRTYKLIQYHFHTPSENHIEGKSFAMEMHLVHADQAGNLAVVGVMFQPGAENPALAQLWKQMPLKEGDKHALAAKVASDRLLPRDRSYYRFNGSLTTPPCSEGVLWLVMKKPLQASKAQIASFAKTLHEPNNRPLQPVNARPILR